MNTIKNNLTQPAIKIHEAAHLFPEMTDEAFLKLKEDTGLTVSKYQLSYKMASCWTRRAQILEEQAA